MCLVHRGVWLGSLLTLLNMWLFWLLLFCMFLWKGGISEKKLSSPRWILYECICYNYTPCVLVQDVARIACNESMSEVIMCVRVLFMLCSSRSLCLHRLILLSCVVQGVSACTAKQGIQNTADLQRLTLLHVLCLIAAMHRLSCACTTFCMHVPLL